MAWSRSVFRLLTELWKLEAQGFDHTPTGGSGKVAAAQGRVERGRHRRGAGDAGRSRVQIERVGVYPHRRGISGRQIVEDVRGESAGGNVDRSAGGQDVTHSLVVVKEKQLVLDDAAADRPGPLPGNREGARRIRGIVEEVVGVQNPFVVVERRVSVEIVGAGFGDIVYLRARLASVLAGIAVDDDRRLLDLVGAERQVARARVVQVEVRDPCYPCH